MLIHYGLRTDSYQYRRSLNLDTYPKFHFIVFAGEGAHMEIPADVWPKIREAVEAYNEWGATR